MYKFKLPVPRAVIYVYSRLDVLGLDASDKEADDERAIQKKCQSLLLSLGPTSQTGLLIVSPKEGELFYRSLGIIAKNQKIRAFYEYRPRLKKLMSKFGNPIKLSEEEEFKALQSEIRKIANATLRRAAAIVRQFYNEYPVNWIPHLKLDWNQRHKNHRSGYSHDHGIFGNYGGISIAMYSIVSRDGSPIGPIYREALKIYQIEEIGSFVSDKWQHHLIARICHEVARVAQHYYYIEIRKEGRFDSKCETPEGFIEIYTLLRRKLLNEDLKAYTLANQERLDALKFESYKCVKGTRKEAIKPRKNNQSRRKNKRYGKK